MMLVLLYVAAAAVLAFCLWLLCWWNTAEPALNGWLARRAVTRAYRRAAPGFLAEMLSVVLWGWPWFLAGFIFIKLLSRY
jgi:hypothetical protein